MRNVRVQRLLALLGTVALLVAVIGGLRVYIYSFSGNLVVAKGRSENVTAAPASRFTLVPSLGNMVQRRVPGEAIPFEDRKTSGKLVDPNAPYDIAALPFSLRLDSVNPIEVTAPVEQLKIVGPDSDSSVNIAQGVEVALGSSAFRVETTRKWSGLLRDAAGSEMAAISLRHPGEEWTEGIFLDAHTWRPAGDSTSIWFEWYPSEEAAVDAVAKRLPDIKSARWGAVDGTAINWFDSFVPGTGATLRNGKALTLLALDEQFVTEAGACPAIEVEISEQGQTRAEWFPANRFAQSDPVRFEWPSRMPYVFLLGAWMDNQVAIAGYANGQLKGYNALNWGETWTPEGVPYEIRVDQVLEKAVPVKREDSPVYEAILTSADGELRVRQGESVRVEDYLVEFVREAEAPVVQYTLSVIDSADSPARKITIGPEDTVVVGSWSFSQGPPPRDPLRTASLRAEYSYPRAWLRIPLALALGLYVVYALQLGAEKSLKEQA